MKMTTRAQARQVVQRVDPGLASGAADVRGVAVAALGSLQGRGEASGGRVADETYQDGTSLFEDHDDRGRGSHEFSGRALHDRGGFSPRTRSAHRVDVSGRDRMADLQFGTRASAENLPPRSLIMISTTLAPGPCFRAWVEFLLWAQELSHLRGRA